MQKQRKHTGKIKRLKNQKSIFKWKINNRYPREINQMLIKKLQEPSIPSKKKTS